MNMSVFWSRLKSRFLGSRLGTTLHSLRRFSFNGRGFRYFSHPYNMTWMTERTVEVPIVMHYVRSFRPKRMLEVGNVLSHYVIRDWTVVDKYEEAEGVVNCDVAGYLPEQRYDLIVSISTLEHVGFDESPKDPSKPLAAFDHLCGRCLEEKGRILITIPLGYNGHLDEMLLSGAFRLDEEFYLKRVSECNRWVQTGKEQVRGAAYNRPYPFANAIFLGVKQKG